MLFSPARFQMGIWRKVRRMRYHHIYEIEITLRIRSQEVFREIRKMRNDHVHTKLRGVRK